MENILFPLGPGIMRAPHVGAVPQDREAGAAHQVLQITALCHEVHRAVQDSFRARYWVFQ